MIVAISTVSFHNMTLVTWLSGDYSWDNIASYGGTMDVMWSILSPGTLVHISFKSTQVNISPNQVDGYATNMKGFTKWITINTLWLLIHKNLNSGSLLE